MHTGCRYSIDEGSATSWQTTRHIKHQVKHLKDIFFIITETLREDVLKLFSSGERRRVVYTEKPQTSQTKQF